jgi:acetyl-CoA acetyltransferase
MASLIAFQPNRCTAKLRAAFRTPGTVTAGNASGVNDGAAAMIIASAEAVERHGLPPRARVLGMASAGVPPRVMGIGPVPSTRKLMERLGFKIGDFDLVEINEAFASQALACLRQLGLPDDAGASASGRACRWQWRRCNSTILEKIGFGHFGRTKYPLFCVLYEGFTDT